MKKVRRHQRSLLLREFAPSGAVDLYADFLLFDTFTDPDGTAIEAHTPEKDVSGAGWSTTGAAAWTINNNELIGDIEEAPPLLIDLQTPDIDVTMNVRTGGSYSSTIPLFRYTDPSDHISVVFFVISGVLAMYRIAGGGASQTSLNVGLTTETEYLLRVKMGLDDIAQVWLDGTLRITKDVSATIRANKLGILNSDPGSDILDVSAIAA